MRSVARIGRTVPWAVFVLSLLAVFCGAPSDLRAASGPAPAGSGYPTIVAGVQQGTAQDGLPGQLAGYCDAGSGQPALPCVVSPGTIVPGVFQTTAAFVQPAMTGENGTPSAVTVSFASTAGLSENIFLECWDPGDGGTGAAQGGGYEVFTVPTSTTATLLWWPWPGSSARGATIQAGAICTPNAAIPVDDVELYGDGSNGALTIATTGGNDTLSVAAYYSSIRWTGTPPVTPLNEGAGWPIYVSGAADMRNGGIIQTGGGTSAGGAGNANGTAGAANTQAGGVLPPGGPGGAGGAGAGNDGGAGVKPTANQAFNGGLGGAGGAAGGCTVADAGGAGGAVTTTFLPGPPAYAIHTHLAPEKLLISALVQPGTQQIQGGAGGGGGGGGGGIGGTNKGGGGGGGGGGGRSLFLAAGELLTDGTTATPAILADGAGAFTQSQPTTGGAGATPTADAGGGGGGGGGGGSPIYLRVGTRSGTVPIIGLAQTSGGNGGPGGNAGQVACDAGSGGNGGNGGCIAYENPPGGVSWGCNAATTPGAPGGQPVNGIGGVGGDGGVTTISLMIHADGWGPREAFFGASALALFLALFLAVAWCETRRRAGKETR
jgi:hypothetical protein